MNDDKHMISVFDDTPRLVAFGAGGNYQEAPLDFSGSTPWEGLSIREMIEEGRNR